MQEGAWGMSPGLIYVPSSFADSAEIVEIAKVIGEHGGIYASHNPPRRRPSAGRGERSPRQSAARVSCPCTFRTSNPPVADAWGLVRRAAGLIEDARARGENGHGRPVPVHRFEHVAGCHRDSDVGPGRRTQELVAGSTIPSRRRASARRLTMPFAVVTTASG